MEQEKKNVLVEEVLMTSDKLFRKLLPTIPHELLALDITMPQMKIMLMLFMHGPMRMGVIASEMDVTLPTATSLVDRLVEKDYVLRESQPDDRRVVRCRLSKAGHKTIGGIWESSRGNVQKLLEELEYAKLEMLRQVLQYMLETANTLEKPGIIENQFARISSDN